MPYTIGYDFGSESGRALLVDVADGRELATAVVPYPNVVLDRSLPDGTALGHDWALQHPEDYLLVLEQATRAVIAEAAVDPAEIIGLGTDFTACTVLPTRADGTPLCLLPEWRSEPHAWVKLWKHHAAQPWADRVNAVAEERGEPWLAEFGGKISSEWVLPKAAQVADEAPAVWAATERFIEAADWIVWQLTGTETRNACTAGYKAQWGAERGYPSREFLNAVQPELGSLLDKLGQPVPLGERAGSLTPGMAERMGLQPGIAVAVGNVDAHVAVPACGISSSGTMVSIMGTSCCDILCGDDFAVVPGACGVVKDGVLPGLFGYEAGQSGFGDHFAWLSRFLGAGDPGHQALESEAQALGPGGSGLLALDWWNGNRSVLVDADLTGLLVGMDLQTSPAMVYRALIEGLAFGKRMIIDTFVEHGVAIDGLVACGGIAEKNRLFMQTMADVIGRPIATARSAQTPALGSAIFGALAAGAGAGGYSDVAAAADAMGGLGPLRFDPDPQATAIYDELYPCYVELHDQLGRRSEVMKRLKQIRRQHAS